MVLSLSNKISLDKGVLKTSPSLVNKSFALVDPPNVVNMYDFVMMNQLTMTLCVPHDPTAYWWSLLKDASPSPPVYIYSDNKAAHPHHTCFLLSGQPSESNNSSSKVPYLIYPTDPCMTTYVELHRKIIPRRPSSKVRIVPPKSNFNTSRRTLSQAKLETQIRCNPDGVPDSTFALLNELRFMHPTPRATRRARSKSVPPIVSLIASYVPSIPPSPPSSNKPNPDVPPSLPIKDPEGLSVPVVEIQAPSAFFPEKMSGTTTLKSALKRPSTKPLPISLTCLLLVMICLTSLHLLVLLT